MTLHVRDAGTWKGVIDLQVKDGGSWKAVQEGHVKDGGSWKLFYSVAAPPSGGSRSVTVSPSPATKTRHMNNFNTSGYVSIDITATALNFTSPVYSWARTSGASDAGAFSATGTTSATVNIGATIGVFETYTETWAVTVKEASDPTISITVSVVVNLRCENLS